MLTDEQQFFPWATFVLMSVCLVVYVLTASNPDFFVKTLALDTFNPNLLNFFSYAFVHADLTHLLGNMLILLPLGMAIEDKFGSKNFLLVFILSTATSSLLVILVSLLTSQQLLLVGMSSTLFGMFVVASIFEPESKVPTLLIVLSFMSLITSFDLQSFLQNPLFMSLLFIGIAALFASIFLFPTIPTPLAFVAFVAYNLFYFYRNGEFNITSLAHLLGIASGIFSLFVLRFLLSFRTKSLR